VPVLLYKLYGARTILNTIIQSLTPHNSMLNMSLVRHSVTLSEIVQSPSELLTIHRIFAVQFLMGAQIPQQFLECVDRTSHNLKRT